jgi:TRAP-type C4-dicarboxylate transport system substrate-binding protein
MKPIVMKFGGYQAPASVHNRAAKRFGELLEQKLGDRVAFELIGSVLKLGRGSGDLVPMVERGELSLCYMSTVRFSKAAPSLQLLELPFVVKDRATVFRALDGEYGKEAARRIDENTLCRVLGFWDNGFRHLTNRVRPIRKPQDCRGLRIRTQASELHGEVFRALGFEPIVCDVKDFVEQIGTDRFQAHDNALTTITATSRSPGISGAHPRWCATPRTTAAGRRTCRPPWTQRPGKPPPTSASWQRRRMPGSWRSSIPPKTR